MRGWAGHRRHVVSGFRPCTRGATLLIAAVQADRGGRMHWTGRTGLPVCARPIPGEFPARRKRGSKAQKYTTPAASTSAMPLSRSAAKAPARPSPCHTPLTASSRTWNTATSEGKGERLVDRGIDQRPVFLPFADSQILADQNDLGKDRGVDQGSSVLEDPSRNRPWSNMR